jgi:hypothetical protein
MKMVKIYMREVLGIVVVSMFVSTVVSGAQINSATDVTEEEYLAVKNGPDGGVDRQVKIVDIGRSNVAVGILHRDALEATGGPARGIVHSLVTEVYYIYSGSGTLVTGGMIGDRRDIPADSDIVTTLVGESFHNITVRWYISTISDHSPCHQRPTTGINVVHLSNERMHDPASRAASGLKRIPM